MYQIKNKTCNKVYKNKTPSCTHNPTGMKREQIIKEEGQWLVVEYSRSNDTLAFSKSEIKAGT